MICIVLRAGRLSFLEYHGVFCIRNGIQGALSVCTIACIASEIKPVLSLSSQNNCCKICYTDCRLTVNPYVLWIFKDCTCESLSSVVVWETSRLTMIDLQSLEASAQAAQYASSGGLTSARTMPSTTVPSPHASRIPPHIRPYLNSRLKLTSHIPR